ncbi:protein LIM3-like [Rosa sericea]
MEMLNLPFMVLAAFAVIGILLSSQVDVVLGQACQGDMQGLMTQCAVYVQKGTVLPSTPSQGCCTAIRTLDIPCACQHVTKMVEQLVDMDKVVKVVRSCGIDIPRGMKCGSYTVPPSSG